MGLITTAMRKDIPQGTLQENRELLTRSEEESILCFLVLKKYGDITIDSENPWKLTVPDMHVHTDISKDSKGLSYKDKPLCGEGATFGEAITNLLILGTEHPVVAGTVCDKFSCPHYFEF